MSFIDTADKEPKVDPGNDLGRVETLAIITQQVGAGDGTSLHAHDVDEAITILAGSAEVVLGEESRPVGPGDVIFIPARAPHRTTNLGQTPLRIHAVFGATSIEISTLDGDAPGRSRYDMRTDTFEPVP